MPGKFGWKKGEGNTYHPLYSTWSRMKERCNNPNHSAYHRYGGRGIKVCERWLDFTNFIKDMGDKPYPDFTLDRINNDLGYYKENCRWASRKTQYENRPQTWKINFDGKTQSIRDWSKETGLMIQTIRRRIKMGWTVETALTTAVVTGDKRKYWRNK